MIRTVIVLVLVLPLAAFSQERINKSKTEVKKELDQYVADHPGLSPSLSGSDSTLVLSVTPPGSLPLTYSFSFNRKGICIAEKTIAPCDSCIRQLFHAILEKRAYQWKKINENQYVSKFSSQLLLELPVEEQNFSFIIYRAQWTKELYDILTKN